ncbi:MAG: prepilin peptidase [Candidatus Levybacteria bacterium]|nr:prepilin peptidase [Candidatus Levybacteria bacterium]
MLIILLFLFGLAIGSFLNVLIDRIPRNEPIVKSRSYCESCKKKLKWIDLIPVLSFIFLKGECRYCRSPISFYYPTVEFLTGILFISVVFLLPTSGIMNYELGIRNIAYMGYNLLIISALIVIFFTDLKYGIVPDKITYPVIIFSLFYLIFNFPLSNPIQSDSTFNFVLSALFAFMFFLLIFVITKGRGMGFGDVKLVFLLGLFLGFPKIVVALYLAFLTGAVISLILIMFRKKKFFGSTIPFGPFLVIGTIISLFFGDLILKYILPFLA